MSSEPRPPDHRTHDRFLVASLLDPDLPTDVRDRGEALVAGCRACAELLADLRAVAAATAALPVPPRPRDYRLTAEDAARLRPRGWRRLVAAVGAPRLAVLRPLGAGLATLGLAGLLLTATPLGGAVPGAAAPEVKASPAAGEGMGAYELSRPDEVAASPVPRAEAPSPEVVTQGDDTARHRTTSGAGAAAGATVPFGLGFGLLLVLGLGLLLIRLAAERAVGRRAPPR